MNNKISVSQLQALIIITSLGFEILILPKLITGIAELAIILISGLLISILAVYSNVLITESKVLSFIYSVKNILVIVLMTKILADVVGNVLLANMPIYRIIIIIVFISAYSAYMGIEPISRISQMLFWFILIGTIYVYAMAVPDININNITMIYDIKKLSSAVFLSLVINVSEIIILIKPFVNNNKNSIIVSVILAFVMVSFICLIIIAKIGINGIKNIDYPFFEIMYTSNAPGILIKRQEGIFISLWVISALISIFVYYGATVNYMETLKIDKRFSVIFIMLFVFIADLCYNNRITPIRTYCFLQILGGFVTVLIIPLFYLFRKKA